MSEEKQDNAEKIKEQQLSENSSAENKRSLKQKRLRLAAKIALAALGILIIAFIFRDIVIENSIRHVGTMLTGTKVEIADFNSSLSGRIELKNITVANPEGYRNQHAVKIENILIKLSVPTLLTDEPVIEKVEVNGVYIDFEIKKGKSNLEVIQNNLSGTDDGDSGKEAKEKDKKEEDDEEEDKTASGPEPLFKRIALTSMSVTFSSSALETSLPIPLPPVYLYNIGGKGYPVSATILKITNAVMTGINKAGGNLLSGVDSIGDAGKSAIDKVKKLFK